MSNPEFDNVTFRRERPEVIDPARAGTTQSFSPAAIIQEQQSAAILQHSFMTCRHGNAPSVTAPARSFSPTAMVKRHQSAAPNVNVLTDVGDGHETNHTAHQRILTNQRKGRGAQGLFRTATAMSRSSTSTPAGNSHVRLAIRPRTAQAEERLGSVVIAIPPTAVSMARTTQTNTSRSTQP
jgi:hypothetical protein